MRPPQPRPMPRPAAHRHCSASPPSSSFQRHDKGGGHPLSCRRRRWRGEGSRRPP
uniref:Uncharacterized protein n=1 Tax=Arundo donax TaxID=35708 RepID=A0A0A8YE80_ARUDO